MPDQSKCDQCHRRRALPDSPLCGKCQRFCARGPTRLPKPTETLAASTERVEVYLARVASKRVLWHPDDNWLSEPERLNSTAHRDAEGVAVSGIIKRFNKFLARTGSGRGGRYVSLGKYRSLREAVLAIKAYKRWRSLYAK